MSMEVTNVDLKNVVIRGDEYRDELVTFGDAGTLAAGTILARDSDTGNMVPFVVGGTTNENGIPKAVLKEPVTADEAGDVPARPLVAGVVNQNRLVIDADGDDSNVTSEVVDQLRSYGITPVKTREISKRDNQ